MIFHDQLSGKYFKIEKPLAFSQGLYQYIFISHGYFNSFIV